MRIKGRPGLVNSSTDTELPVNTLFLNALCQGIEQERASHKPPSSAYTPSGMNCMRAMFYKRSSYVPDLDRTEYTDVGMANTGTGRHEDIQKALIYMTTHGSRFKYVDVARYVQEKQSRGKCLQLVVTGKDGAETALWDKERDVRFRCDGIIYDSVTHLFYLFEFKNQISSTAAGKACVDMKHHCQVDCYCAELDLQYALVTYENRDTCQLYVPEVYEVTEYAKLSILKKIDDCEDMAKHAIVPARPTNLSPSECKWCRYKSYCKADGAEGGRKDGTHNS